MLGKRRAGDAFRGNLDVLGGIPNSEESRGMSQRLFAGELKGP